MSQIITVHSYRGGTGKSSTTANLALLLASAGRRVALVDTDIQTPSLDVMFSGAMAPVRRSLADYLMGHCEIEDAAYPADTDAGHEGLFLVPARNRAAGINEIMGRGYDVGLLREGFDRLIDSLALDVLLLDTHAGFNNETVTSMASADVLVIMTRADRLDLAGAGETMALAGRLGCVRMSVAVNLAPGGVVHDRLRSEVESAYATKVTAVLPYAPEMASLAGERLFSTAYPHHPLVAGYRRIISEVSNGTTGIRR
ncbi:MULTISPECIES: MinD/ParA family protein [unclassified Streptomyces]|uniref:MinD/ParA family ATP-binding protein n=1 Tax=unclassified Streptomyces TaxID=2593676 RepID=UPI001BEC9CF5|nr:MULTISPECIES: MinD/ParA family protein [unclassified Streptomyces]MBT2405541.1 MinD/ParA family protein [Streptomyces sp. ISL-21]MBT2454460.1 MinD/ParA family protein [Streptomyces sp. ISL-86]MBT2607780.1 MinD/ParA family protein [Streptomyces sp. ISL-87]